MDGQERAQIAGALREMGHQVHFTTVAKFLRQLGYRLQANGKTKEGASHPDRDAQFSTSTDREAAMAAGRPVISVDTKKKELVGDFKNTGREWRPKGEPGWCAPTTSRTSSSARRSPTASTT